MADNPSATLEPIGQEQINPCRINVAECLLDQKFGNL